MTRRQKKHRREAVVVGGMECEEAKRLKHLEDENRRLKQLVADQALDILMLKHFSGGNW
jgi:putative transposase